MRPVPLIGSSEIGVGSIGNGLLSGGRQIDGEGRAAILLRFDHDEAAVILNDRIRGGETEAVATWLGCEVGVENLLQVLFRDANAFIAHPNPNVIPGDQIGNRPRCLRRARKIVAINVERAAVRHGLFGVDDQVRDHLADLTGIKFRRPEIRRDGNHAAALRAAEREADGFLDETGDASGLFGWRASAGKSKELVGEVASAERGIPGVVEPFSHFVVRRKE